jgi:hypothetical protein
VCTYFFRLNKHLHIVLTDGGAKIFFPGGANIIAFGFHATPRLFYRSAFSERADGKILCERRQSHC